MDFHKDLSNLFNKLVVHLECPQLQASRQLCDGGEGEKELLSTTQGDIRVDQLSLLNPLLLLLCGDHRQDFLEQEWRQERRGGEGEVLPAHSSSQHIKRLSIPTKNIYIICQAVHHRQGEETN